MDPISVITQTFSLLKGVTTFCLAYNAAEEEQKALAHMLLEAARLLSNLQRFRHHHRDLCTPERLREMLMSERNLWRQVILVDNVIIAKMPGLGQQQTERKLTRRILRKKQVQRTAWVALHKKTALEMELAVRDNMGAARGAHQHAMALLDRDWAETGAGVRSRRSPYARDLAEMVKEVGGGKMGDEKLVVGVEVLELGN